MNKKDILVSIQVREYIREKGNICKLMQIVEGLGLWDCCTNCKYSNNKKNVT